MKHGIDQPTWWGQVAQFINDDPGQHQIRLWTTNGVTKVACACSPHTAIGSLAEPTSPAVVWQVYETHAPRPSRSSQ